MAKAKSKRERSERRFYPHSSTSPKVVGIVGGLGAALAGAGAYGQFGPMKLEEPLKIVPWLLASGAALIGGAFWFGTSGEPSLRVGDGGLGTDKGSTPSRIPWHELASLTYDSGANALVAKGKDELGTPLTITVKIAAHPHAAAWLVKEARARVGKIVDVAESIDEALPSASDDQGELVKLEPVQVVGKRCAASDKIISFEPDARVCNRCERVYHKNHVPKKCACGAALGAGKGKDDEDAA